MNEKEKTKNGWDKLKHAKLWKPGQYRIYKAVREGKFKDWKQRIKINGIISIMKEQIVGFFPKTEPIIPLNKSVNGPGKRNRA